MTGFVDVLKSEGVELRLHEGRIQHRPSVIPDELRTFIDQNRAGIVAELHMRSHGSPTRRTRVATPTLAPLAHVEDEHEAEDTDPRPWWEREGFDARAWLLEAEAWVRFEVLDGQVVSRARGPHVPPWVCSDAYQLERVGVLLAAVIERDQGRKATEAPRTTTEPPGDSERLPRAAGCVRELRAIATASRSSDTATA